VVAVYRKPSHGIERDVAQVGLAHWDKGGGTPWRAPSHTPGVAWCDCYSLNVGRELVQACPYHDFPLVEIDASGICAVTPNHRTWSPGLTSSPA
jgi:hypothetical protein